ncbi:riboflavin synthase [Clostridium sp.]|uniref:riboflavin synthase n=1 Tax=Clostridium sp. TaxID=1506 RepID=UPI003F369916
MFTGLVEEIGEIKSIKKSKKSAFINVKARQILKDIKIGDSISTNGVCLTVVSFTENEFSVEAMAETLERSNIGKLSNGEKVNLERAMKASDRFGGHIVSGHIDGRGVITSYKNDDIAIWITIEAKEEILKYIVEKGSITLDGVSLTVAYVDNEKFKVGIIPHTSKFTTLTSKSLGDEINIECDVIGKYVEKLVNFQKVEKKIKDIDINFLIENGF